VRIDGVLGAGETPDRQAQGHYNGRRGTRQTSAAARGVVGSPLGGVVVGNRTNLVVLFIVQTVLTLALLLTRGLRPGQSLESRRQRRETHSVRGGRQDDTIRERRRRVDDTSLEGRRRVDDTSLEGRRRVDDTSLEGRRRVDDTSLEGRGRVDGTGLGPGECGTSGSRHRCNRNGRRKCRSHDSNLRGNQMTADIRAVSKLKAVVDDSVLREDFVKEHELTLIERSVALVEDSIPHRDRRHTGARTQVGAHLQNHTESKRWRTIR